MPYNRWHHLRILLSRGDSSDELCIIDVRA